METQKLKSVIIIVITFFLSFLSEQGKLLASKTPGKVYIPVDE